MDRDTFKTVIHPLLGEDCLPVINWLKRKLLSELKCPTCDQKMNWTKYAKTMLCLEMPEQILHKV